MKKIGLTGGIGVGKTYVAQLFSQIGVPVFNADFEAKICLVEDTNLVNHLKVLFGDNIYFDNTLQKDKLADIVFNDKEALSNLNRLVHPLVKERFKDWCNNQDSKIVLKETAILFESQSHIDLDAVICVSANKELRIERIVNRDGLSTNQIMCRMDNQMSQTEKEHLADFIIINNGSQLLLPQIVKILKEME